MLLVITCKRPHPKFLTIFPQFKNVWVHVNSGKPWNTKYRAIFPWHGVWKALNGIQWEVAHPLTLNYGASITSKDATINHMCHQWRHSIHRYNKRFQVCKLPHFEYSKKRDFTNLKPFAVPMYGMLTHMVTSLGLKWSGPLHIKVYINIY